MFHNIRNPIKSMASQCLLTIRCMSKHPKIGSPWPKGFEDPFASRVEFKEAKESGDEYAKKMAVSIKSAPKESTVSVFRDYQMDKFSRLFMKAGRREKSIEILNDICKKIKETQHKKRNAASNADASSSEIIVDPITIIHKAIDNCSPLMVTKSVPVGSVNYTVPTAIQPPKQRFYGMKWIVEAGRNRPTRKEGELFAHFVAREIIDASENEGRVVSKKEELHRICYQNRAYVNYYSRRNKGNSK